MVMEDKIWHLSQSHNYWQIAANLTIYCLANRHNPNRRDHIDEIADTIRNIVSSQRAIAPATCVYAWKPVWGRSYSNSRSFGRCPRIWWWCTGIGIWIKTAWKYLCSLSAAAMEKTINGLYNFLIFSSSWLATMHLGLCRKTLPLSRFCVKVITLVCQMARSCGLT